MVTARLQLLEQKQALVPSSYRMGIDKPDNQQQQNFHSERRSHGLPLPQLHLSDEWGFVSVGNEALAASESLKQSEVL